MEFQWWKKIIAEVFGTFCLTFVGCGTAIGNGGSQPAVIAIAFGGVIVAMAYSIGPISGCHINPAVSFAMLVNGRLPFFDFIFYVIGQFVGGILAGFLLVAIEGLTTELKGSGYAHGLGENGIFSYGFESASTHGINIGGGILIEAVMTFIFITVILVNTAEGSPTGDKAGIVIGVTLSILIGTGLQFTGTSLNPARSFGPALALLVKRQGRAIAQYWVFLVSPLLGALLAALFCRFVLETEKEAGKNKKKIYENEEAAPILSPLTPLSPTGMPEDADAEAEPMRASQYKPAPAPAPAPAPNRGEKKSRPDRRRDQSRDQQKGQKEKQQRDLDEQ